MLCGLRPLVGVCISVWWLAVALREAWSPYRHTGRSWRSIQHCTLRRGGRCLSRLYFRLGGGLRCCEDGRLDEVVDAAKLLAMPGVLSPTSTSSRTYWTLLPMLDRALYLPGKRSDLRRNIFLHPLCVQQEEHQAGGRVLWLCRQKRLNRRKKQKKKHTVIQCDEHVCLCFLILLHFPTISSLRKTGTGIAWMK